MTRGVDMRGKGLGDLQLAVPLGVLAWKSGNFLRGSSCSLGSSLSWCLDGHNLDMDGVQPSGHPRRFCRRLL